MTGKEILQQSLRERCLHKLLTTKYKEEGESYMYWTFFAMLGSCFAQDHHKAIDPPRSFDDCFDWASFDLLYCSSIINLRSQILQILPSILSPFSSSIEFGKALERIRQSGQYFIAQKSHCTGFLSFS